MQKKDDKHSLENAARQSIINFALFKLLEQNGGSAELKFSELDPCSHNGLAVKIDTEKQLVTIETIQPEAMQALIQSNNEVKH